MELSNEELIVQSMADPAVHSATREAALCQHLAKALDTLEEKEPFMQIIDRYRIGSPRELEKELDQLEELDILLETHGIKDLAQLEQVLAAGAALAAFYHG